MTFVLEFIVYFMFFTVGIFGFFCSICSLIFIVKRPILHNAFGYICAAQSVTEASVLFIFVFWAAVSTFSSQNIDQNIIGIIMGHFINYFYFSSFYLHLLKSVNRFCAIVFSVKYRIWFSEKIAKILIAIIYINSFLNTVPLFIYDCNIYFDSESYTWVIRTDECFQIYGYFDDFATCSTTMVISLICDIITFSYFRLRMKKVTSTTKNEIKFALNAFLTTFFYLTMVISFFYLSTLSLNFWVSYITRTWIWMLGHTVNQFSFIVFIILMQSKSTTVKILISSTQISVQRK